MTALQAVPDEPDHPESSTALQAAWAVMCVAAALCHNHLAVRVLAALDEAHIVLTGHAEVIAATVRDMLDAGQMISYEAVLRELRERPRVGRGQRLDDMGRYIAELVSRAYPERWPEPVAELATAAHLDHWRQTIDRMTRAGDECPASDLLELMVIEGRKVRASHDRMMAALDRVGGRLPSEVEG